MKMKRVCPYCLQTDMVVVESYPHFRTEVFIAVDSETPWAEPVEEHCTYNDESGVPYVYCPECENRYVDCYSVEDALEIMIIPKEE